MTCPPATLPTASMTLDPRRAQTSTLLAALGVPRTEWIARRTWSDRRRRAATLLRPAFWDRPVDFFRLLECARSAWRARVRRSHPDHGGDPAACAQANAVWREVRRRFAQHGYT